MSTTRTAIRNFSLIASVVISGTCAAGQASADDRTRSTVATISRSTVAVEGVTSGSGVIVDRQGLVLTASHVAGRAGRGCFVVLADGSRVVGVVVAVNTKHDFAVIKIASAPDLQAAPIASSGDVNHSTPLTAVGHSGGYQADRATAVRTGQRVAPPEGMAANLNVMVTDIELVRGDSGGPLFNAAGEVVAIHVMALQGGGSSYGVHVSVDTVRPVLAEVSRRMGSQQFAAK